MSMLEEHPETGRLIKPESLTRELERAFLLARREDTQEGDGFEDISALELHQLGRQVAGCGDIWEAYNALAEPSESGSCYYDLVIAPQHEVGLSRLGEALRRQEPSRVAAGVDLGTGTGNSALVLSPFCEAVVAVDLNGNLLSWARRKLEQEQARRKGRFGFVAAQGNILGLVEAEPKLTGIFEIAIAHGIDSYFTPEEIATLYRQVHQLLKPKGRFYRYSAAVPTEHPVYQTSARARLAGVVAKMIFGLSYAPFYSGPAGASINPSSVARRIGFKEKVVYEGISPYPEQILQWTKK